MLVAERYHDFSCGHRVVGHEGKCRFLHGHNYRIHFSVTAPGLDSVGRVVDFSEINSRLCQWLELNWDHKCLVWKEDPLFRALSKMVHATDADISSFDEAIFGNSLVWVDFNPTAENMADYLLNTVGPAQLADTGLTLLKVVIEETRKCQVTMHL